MQTGSAVFEKQNCGVFPLAVGKFVADHQETFLSKMAGWMQDGKITYLEDIRPDLNTAPTVFREMLEGGNFGKTIIQVADDPTRRQG